MHPTLYQAYGYKFHAYPTMLAVAFLACTLLTVRDLQQRDPPVDITPQAGLWVFFGALFGAKAFWILQYSEPKYLFHMFFVWEAGLVFYGGLIGGIAAAYLYLRVYRLPKFAVADAVAPYLIMGEAITRIGCFLNGCCWGAVTAVPWAVRFPKGSHPYQQHFQGSYTEITGPANAMQAAVAKAFETLGLAFDPAHPPLLSAPVHPTQLYMVLGLIIAAVLLKAAQQWKPFDGAVGLGYLFCYGLVRFLVEAFRGDSARSISTMTVSQTISMSLMLGAVALFVAGCFWTAHRRQAAALAPADAPSMEYEEPASPDPSDEDEPER